MQSTIKKRTISLTHIADANLTWDRIPLIQIVLFCVYITVFDAILYNIFVFAFVVELFHELYIFNTYFGHLQAAFLFFVVVRLWPQLSSWFSCETHYTRLYRTPYRHISLYIYFSRHIYTSKMFLKNIWPIVMRFLFNVRDDLCFMTPIGSR